MKHETDHTDRLSPLPRRRFLQGLGGAAAALALGGTAGLSAAQERAAGKGAAADRGAFRFVFMPDTHLRDEYGSHQGLAKALDAAMALDPQPAFIVSSGDLCHNLRDKGLEEAVEQADTFVKIWNDHTDLPSYHGLGNHDPAGWREGDWPEDHPLFGFELLRTKLKMPGLRYGFDHGGWHFAQTHNIVLTKPGEYISEFNEEAVDFIRQDLTAHRGQPTMLFGHFPPVSAISFLNGRAEVEDNEWHLGIDRMSRNPMALINAIHEAGADDEVKAFVSGHIHRLDNIEAKGQTFICAGSVSGAQWQGPEVDTQEGFGVIDCRPDGTFDYRYHDYGWQSRA